MEHETIADELRSVRQGLGLTQLQFAHLFNRTEPVEVTTSRADISRYETGIIMPPATKYRKFMSLKNTSAATE